MYLLMEYSIKSQRNLGHFTIYHKCGNTIDKIFKKRIYQKN